ncbi:MAG: helix-turn-helix domain-containing protein [Acidimicrobiaceae bacterium]|nr:helix-turn-helix domain-containing protein [Acidimicrobiia bacterium]MCY4494520.1 helix-turn-helix domain-containing protein [Acidimicrobiaceae bacterium]
MAQRLCFGERSRVEAMREAQLSVDEIAERLGRHRSTVYRELDRSGPVSGVPVSLVEYLWPGASLPSRRPAVPPSHLNNS